MKTFKKADLIFQITLIITFSILTIAGVVNINTAYFVVGGLQILSMIIHSYNYLNTRKGSRRYLYQRVAAFTIIVSAAAALTPYLNYALSILRYILPAMAVYYTWLCLYEVRHPTKRPLELI
jgi:hypothetical protein